MSRSTPCRYPNRPVGVAVAAVAMLVLSACGGGTEESSSTSATTPATVPSTVPSTTEPTGLTTAPIVTSPSTEPTTTMPTTTTTTATSATTGPTTSTAAPTTTAASNRPGTAFIAADERLLEVDVVTGATVRVLDDFFSGEGLFRGALRLSPDRSTIWFSEGFEDSWFGCETSIGSFGRVDAATGAMEVLGVGSSVEPSADGELIAYLTSSLCLPDPEQPEFWVLTPSDRVVVRQLATGEEREFVTETPPDGYDSPGVLLWAGFSPTGSLLVLLGDGRLIDVDLDGSVVIQDHPVVLTDVLGGPVGATAGALIALEFGDEGSTDLFSIDTGSGEPTLLASAGAYMAAGVSADGQIVVSSFEPVTIAPGARVAVAEVPDAAFIYDIDW